MAWLRLLAYVLAIAAAGLLPWLDVLWSSRTHPLFIENSIAQKLQNALLLMIMAAFAVLAFRQHAHRALALLMVLGFACMLIREMDSTLDYRLFDGAWQTLVAVLAVVMLGVAWRGRSALRASLRHWSALRSFGLMLVGLAVLILFSRLFGKEDLWQALMGDGYQRSAKNMAEEGLEVLGYLILLIASLDTLHQLCPDQNTAPPSRSPVKQ